MEGKKNLVILYFNLDWEWKPLMEYMGLANIAMADFFDI